MIIIAMGIFDMTLVEAMELSPLEHSYYSRAYNLKLEREKLIQSYGAYQQRTVQAVEKKGKNYVNMFKTFDEFYNASDSFFFALYPELLEEKDVNPEYSVRNTIADSNRLLRKLQDEYSDDRERFNE